MKVEHTALFVEDLQRMQQFYSRWFGATPGPLYHNPITGLTSCFCSFPDGSCRLELMHWPDHSPRPSALRPLGYAHLAFSLGSRQAVDQLTRQLCQAGCRVVSQPRTTGDGYYESCVEDPEQNQLELTV